MQVNRTMRLYRDTNPLVSTRQPRSMHQKEALGTTQQLRRSRRSLFSFFSVFALYPVKMC